jgi:hypothetical protein
MAGEKRWRNMPALRTLGRFRHIRVKFRYCSESSGIADIAPLTLRASYGHHGAGAYVKNGLSAAFCHPGSLVKRPEG